MAHEITNMRQLRATFWRECENVAGVSRRKIRNYSGNGTMHNTDTRVTFCDWLDNAAKDGRLSESLADRATLD